MRSTGLPGNVLQRPVNSMGPRIDGHGVSIRHEESSEDFLEPSILFVKDRDVAAFGGNIEPMHRDLTKFSARQIELTGRLPGGARLVSEVVSRFA